MKLKFTMLFRYHEETKDTDAFANYLRTQIIPNILKIKGISHVELCHFVPFSFISPNVELDETKYLFQLDMYYESDEAFQQAVSSFNDSFLVEEMIRAGDYIDLYLSYIEPFYKEEMY
ncbi:hypothetical protein [Thermoflavimicrobium dichotomicum]|nr:hypothetical protein [Thermoflavimicrobium dichotomicum]